MLLESSRMALEKKDDHQRNFRSKLERADRRSLSRGRWVRPQFRGKLLRYVAIKLHHDKPIRAYLNTAPVGK